MGKQSPKLRLISKAGEVGSARNVGIAEGFDLLAVGELGNSEAKRVERLVASVCPRAGIIAVARTEWTWDVRPVVVLSEEDGPTLIRLVGPEVSLSKESNTRVRETLERVSRFSHLSSELRDWGVFEEQIWYRRTLVPATVAHLLTGKVKFEESQFKSFVSQMVDALSDWHSHGVVHGHIVTSNCCLYPDGQVGFIDAALGAALINSCSQAPAPLVESAAPELLSAEQPDYSTDVYGLGQVLRRIILVLRKKYRFSEKNGEIEARLEPYARISEKMLSKDPVLRPTLSEIRASLRELEGKPSSASSLDDNISWNKSAPGKIVRAANPITAEVPPEPEPNFEAEVEIEEETEESFFDLDAGGYEEVGAESVAPVTIQKKAPKQSASNLQLEKPASTGSNFWSFIFILSIALLGLWYYFRGSHRYEEPLEYYTQQQLQTFWASRIPSKMVKVAESAVYWDDEENFAADLIVSSANNGDQLPVGIDVGLIRIAFNNKWELDLSTEDRRMALALGVAGLLRTIPSDLEPLNERHPGVILAVTSAAGENVGRHLRSIPAEKLFVLPPPYGPAFRTLLKGQKGVSCADSSVRQLARFGTRGIDQKEELAVFLKVDTAQRLRALSWMFSSHNRLARLLLDILLNHPNFVLEYPQLEWGRKWGVLDWQELEAGDQLFVVSGLPPAGRVSVQNVGKLFMHPSAVLRAYAIEQALDRIKFSHPGAYDVLQMLKKKPDLLSPEQLFKLANLLENPGKVSEDRIEAWFSTTPPPSVEVVAALLLKTYRQPEATDFDRWSTAYLRTREWRPSVVALQKLSFHPDDYTRLFAYTKIYELNDKETARMFLETALAKEKNNAYRIELENMIVQLSE